MHGVEQRDFKFNQLCKMDLENENESKGGGGGRGPS